jgi:isopenicillin N synthase-like dioxygenase
MSSQSTAVIDTTAIPVVDFDGFTGGDPARRAATVAALRAALESYGFLYLRNHGIPDAVLDAMFAQSRAFFALPQEAKDAARSQDPGNTLGYGGLGSQALDEDKPADLKETYQSGPEPGVYRRNVWPEGLPGFRDTAMAFHRAATAACDQLMAAIAVSLGLPETYFEPFYGRRDSTVRLLHYPPLRGTPAPGQIRAGAHTDYGGINLLFQDDEGGLEIQTADGTWVPAPAVPGTTVVNTGDLIERWTNGQFRSSPHRVVNPVGQAAARDRYSMVLFDIPNRDALVTCLEPCQNAERPAKFPPTTVGEHLRARVLASQRTTY